jgi:hypothetical protein
MKPEELRASIERSRKIERLMSGPNTCNEAMAQWNPVWTYCPVCLVVPERDGFIQHKMSEAVKQ